MGIRAWVKRLERDARGEMVAIRQPNGSVKRFPQSELAPAYLDAFDRRGPDGPRRAPAPAVRGGAELV